MHDEEVQFVWSLINPTTIEEESVRQNLLREIAFMWVTTRGNSKAIIKNKGGFKDKQSTKFEREEIIAKGTCSKFTRLKLNPYYNIII